MSSFGSKIPNFRSQKFKQLFKNSHHLLMLHQISQSLRASRAQGLLILSRFLGTPQTIFDSGYINCLGGRGGAGHIKAGPTLTTSSRFCNNARALGTSSQKQGLYRPLDLAHITLGRKKDLFM